MKNGKVKIFDLKNQKNIDYPYQNDVALFGYQKCNLDRDDEDLCFIFDIRLKNIQVKKPNQKYYDFFDDYDKSMQMRLILKALMNTVPFDIFNYLNRDLELNQ